MVRHIFTTSREYNTSKLAFYGARYIYLCVYVDQHNPLIHYFDKKKT